MKDKILMIVFVLVLGSFLTSVLIGVDHYSAPIIKKNRELKIKASILQAFDISFDKDNIEKLFSDNIRTVDEGEKEFYFSKKREVAFKISGMGLWGPINGVIALFPGMKTIKGITIIHQEETPGLGGRIAEQEYLTKFKNKKIVPVLKITAPGMAREDNEVDGITGATMTSKAFEELINSNVSENLKLLESRK